MTENEAIETARATMVQKVVDELAEQHIPLNHNVVRCRLPRDFNYDETLDDFRKFTPTVVPEMAAEPVEDIDEAVPIADNPDALREQVLRLERQTAGIRGEMHTAIEHVRRCRGVLADAINEYQSQLPRRTPLENTRQFLQRSQAERARVAGAVIPGRSRIDEAATWGRGRTAEDFARSRMYSGFRRGSYPGSMKGSKAQ